MELALFFIFFLATVLMVGGLLRQNVEIQEARERAARRRELVLRVRRPRLPVRGPAGQPFPPPAATPEHRPHA